MGEDIQLVGFFRELKHGRPDGPSLREGVADEAGPFDEEIARYLETAPVVLASAGLAVDDVLDPSNKGIGTEDVRSDGTWAWPGDLAYYVRRYHVKLPAEFNDRAQSFGWKAPALGGTVNSVAMSVVVKLGLRTA